MQAELKSIKDETLRIKWRDVIACLGSGTHPTTKHIIACSKLFSGPPYSLNNLKRKHLVSPQIALVTSEYEFILYKSLS